MKKTAIIAMAIVSTMLTGASAAEKAMVYTTQGHFSGSTSQYTVEAYDDGMISIKDWSGAEGYNFDFYPEMATHSFRLDPGYAYDGIFYDVPRNAQKVASFNPKKLTMEGIANNGMRWIDFTDEVMMIHYKFLWTDPTHFVPDMNSPIVKQTWGKWEFEDPRFSMFDIRNEIVCREDGSYTILGFFNSDRDLTFWVNEFDEVVFPTYYDQGTLYTYLDYGDNPDDYLYVMTGNLNDCYATYSKDEYGKCTISLYESFWTLYNDEGSHIYFTWNDNSGVEIMAEGESASTEYYDIQGRKAAGALSPGIYIKRTGNRSEKILVK